jgi:hypothetical protein
MSDASLPATEADGGTDERAHPGRVVRRESAGLGRRRPLRYARLEQETITPGDTDVLIATFRCAAPARCGAFADARRIVTGASMVASPPPRAFASWRSNEFRTTVYIAAFRRAAPPRCGAFADGRRIVAGDEGARV